MSPETGDAVFYTAGNPGVDIVTAEGTTAKGAPVKERVSFNVVPASKVTQVPPTFTPMPLTVTPLPPTATPSPPTATTVPLGGCSSFTSPRLIRPRLPRTSSGATGSFSAPQHCEIGVPAGVGLSVGGTATNVPSSSFLWLLVYASGNYYPQCNNVYKGICGANLSEGVWAVMAFIGKKDCKEHIHLVLVTMNQSDNNQLTQQMVQKASSGDFAFARNELPPSVEEVASIEIETAGRICP